MKTVVVTGSSSGVGMETATALLAEGYRVVGVARRSVDLGENYTHVSFDFAETGQIKALVDGIVASHGWPYALVNCAAVGMAGVLPTLHNSDIERTIAVNLTAPIELTKYLTRGMLDAREGRVVTISSIVASTGYRGLSVYAATKAGLEGFTRSLARDLGRRGITVNCVAPGYLETGMTSEMDETALASIVRRSPLGRMASVSAIAAMVSYLLGPAGADITGTVLTVDAGELGVTASRLTLRQVTRADQWPLWEWRSSDRIRLVSTNDEKIAKDSHSEWFEARFPFMRDQTIMVEWDGETVGWFQIEDWDADAHTGEWGVSLGPTTTPPGLGGAMPLLALGHAFDRLDAVQMGGRVLDINTNMMAIMRRLGIPVASHLDEHLARLDGSVTGVTVYSVQADSWPGIRDRALALLPGSMRPHVLAALAAPIAG